jgi:hypothetical protein
MRLDTIAFLLAIALLFAVAYHASADPIDARAIVRQTRAEEPDTDAAQRRVARSEPALVLAWTAWGEAGALVSEGEVAAIHEVLTTRMRGGSYQRTAWAYSAALRHPRWESSHSMGRAPLTGGWPALHRQHWPRVLAAADEAVAGRLTHGCDARPLEHFGGPHVDRASIARMLRDGMREATCPGYANSFLVRGEP